MAMKRTKPYIVHINPHVRPRDPVDLWHPMMEHWETGMALVVAVMDAVNVWWANLNRVEK
jgi:hypothetical protein